MSLLLSLARCERNLHLAECNARDQRSMAKLSSSDTGLAGHHTNCIAVAFIRKGHAHELPLVSWQRYSTCDRLMPADGLRSCSNSPHPLLSGEMDKHSDQLDHELRTKRDVLALPRQPPSLRHSSGAPLIQLSARRPYLVLATIVCGAAFGVAHRSQR